MKKSMKITWLLLIAAACCIISGCGIQPENEPALPPGSQEQPIPEGKIPEEETEADTEAAADTEAKPSDYADSYWKAVKYARYVYNGEKYEGSTWKDLPIAEAANQRAWQLDLFLFSDGSARLRDLSGSFYSGMSVEGQWQSDENGLLRFTSGHWPNTNEEIEARQLPSLSPVDGEYPEEAGLEGMLAMEYYDGKIYFQRAAMPEKDFQLCMADLQGDWTMVSSEVEGYVTDGREEGILSSLSFVEGAYGMEAVYANHSIYSGINTEFRASLHLKEEALYPGCGNENWSVKLAPQVYEAEEGVSYYLTLTDENTLLFQQFFTFDGMQGVSYQTYKRSREAADALEIKKKLDAQRSQAPANTLLCVGADQFRPDTPGVERYMRVLPLAGQNSTNTLAVISPEYAGLRVFQNGELIHETELGYGETELLLLDIPATPGSCYFEISPDSVTWYTWDISKENVSSPGWINVLGPEETKPAF